MPQDEDTKKRREDYAMEQVNGIKQLDKEEELYKQLNELAKKYDITFDEASERFLKPFILIYIIDFGFRPPEKFIEKHYKRKTKSLEEVYLAMNLTEDNYKEYSFMDITEDNYEELCGLLEKTRNYMLDLRMQYIDYMADFIEKADIIERP